MKLDFDNMAKADSLLRNALLEANESEELCVIFTLESAEVEPSDPKPIPSQFPTKVEYRQALIDRNKAFIHRTLGDTLASLTRLGLRINGPNLMKTVVACGSAEQIHKALGLAKVERAYLDRPMNLIQPIRAAHNLQEKGFNQLVQ